MRTRVMVDMCTRVMVVQSFCALCRCDDDGSQSAAQVLIVCHDYNRGQNVGTCYPELP